MIVRGDIKKYIGAVESEEIAARYYDKYALIIQGLEVSLEPHRHNVYRRKHSLS